MGGTECGTSQAPARRAIRKTETKNKLGGGRHKTSDHCHGVLPREKLVQDGALTAKKAFTVDGLKHMQRADRRRLRNGKEEKMGD